MLRTQTLHRTLCVAIALFAAGCTASRQPITVEEPSYSHVRAGDALPAEVATPATQITSDPIAPELTVPVTTSSWRPTLPPPVAVEPQS